MRLSVVIPLLNEADSLPELYERIKKVVDTEEISYEIIFIDDGSTDNSWEVIRTIQQADPLVKGIRFNKNYGKSQALNAAFARSNGDIVITMDADLQDFPEEIPSLMAKIEEGNDLVSGWKRKRYDNVVTKNIPSKLFNAVARKSSGVSLHDFNCGLKAYRKEVVKNIDVYGEKHRYIPILAKNAGYSRITEKEVQHQARKYGQSKFGSSRFIRGFLDMISLQFLNRFGNHPMYFFGALGSVMFVLGTLFALGIGIYKIYHVWQNIPAKLVTDTPYFYISLVMMILGTQLFIAGFLGEILIIRTNGQNQNYTIEETIE